MVDYSVNPVFYFLHLYLFTSTRLGWMLAQISLFSYTMRHTMNFEIKLSETICLLQFYLTWLLPHQHPVWEHSLIDSKLTGTRHREFQKHLLLIKSKRLVTELFPAQTEATASTLHFDFPCPRQCQARPQQMLIGSSFPNIRDVRDLIVLLHSESKSSDGD